MNRNHHLKKKIFYDIIPLLDEEFDEKYPELYQYNKAKPDYDLAENLYPKG